MCILDEFGIKAKEGDIIEFIMPGFCSGDYIYKVEKINNKLVLKDAPSKIFNGCRDYKIIKENKW